MYIALIQTRVTDKIMRKLKIMVNTKKETILIFESLAFIR